MKINEIILETSRAPLYHGIKELTHALIALQTNIIQGYTTQRHWEGGIRLKDNDPNYQNSYWMKGISFSRSKEFSQKWGDVVFVFDQEKLKQRYKLIPLNWGYSIPSQQSHKKEKEEFLILKKDKNTYIDKETGNLNIKEFQKPEGQLKNLNSYLIEIWAKDSILDYEDKAKINRLTGHNKFKGFYHFNKSTREIEKSKY